MSTIQNSNILLSSNDNGSAYQILEQIVDIFRKFIEDTIDTTKIWQDIEVIVWLLDQKLNEYNTECSLIETINHDTRSSLTSILFHSQSKLRSDTNENILKEIQVNIQKRIKHLINIINITYNVWAKINAMTLVTIDNYIKQKNWIGWEWNIGHYSVPEEIPNILWAFPLPIWVIIYNLIQNFYFLKKTSTDKKQYKITVKVNRNEFKLQYIDKGYCKFSQDTLKSLWQWRKDIISTTWWQWIFLSVLKKEVEHHQWYINFSNTNDWVSIIIKIPLYF